MMYELSNERSDNTTPLWRKFLPFLYWIAIFKERLKWNSSFIMQPTIICSWHKDKTHDMSCGICYQALQIVFVLILIRSCFKIYLYCSRTKLIFYSPVDPTNLFLNTQMLGKTLFVLNTISYMENGSFICFRILAWFFPCFSYKSLIYSRLNKF